MQNIRCELQAKKNTCLQWYAKANAFHNKVSFTSYADVLKNGKQIMVDQNDHTLVQQAASKVRIKNSLHNSKPTSGHRNKKTVRCSGASQIQDKPLLLTNRFYILQHEEPGVAGVTLCHDSPSTAAKLSCLGGNKNGNGQKLGQAMKQDKIQKKVDHSAETLRGNKTKLE